MQEYKEFKEYEEMRVGRRSKQGYLCSLYSSNSLCSLYSFFFSSRIRSFI